MKLVELLIATAVFLGTVSSATFLLFQYEDALVDGLARTQAVKLVEQQLDLVVDVVEQDFDQATQSVATSTSEAENFVIVSEIKNIDNYTKEAIVTAWYKVKQRSVSFSLSRFVVDTRESEGQSSCRPTQDENLWINLLTYTKTLNHLQNLQPTSVVLRDGRVFISSNSSIASAPDVYMFEIDHDSRELNLLASVDTGPGVADLVVVGDHIYVANTSINNQLQIIRITEENSLVLETEYKIPGDYRANSVIGNSIFYKNGYIFLGMPKNQIAELQAVSVHNPLSPTVVASYELNAMVNDITAFKDVVYVASPDSKEVHSIRFNGSSFSQLDQFDALGNASHGKRLVYFLGKIFLGRTVGQAEMYGLSVQDEIFEPLFNFGTGVSVHGVEVYGKLMFLLLNRKNDAFHVFDITSENQQKIIHNQISFLANPIAFSCDKNTFAVVEVGKRITFITFEQ